MKLLFLLSKKRASMGGRALLIGGICFSCSSCAFFAAEYDPCLDGGACPDEGTGSAGAGARGETGGEGGDDGGSGGEGASSSAGGTTEPVGGTDSGGRGPDGSGGRDNGSGGETGSGGEASGAGGDSAGAGGAPEELTRGDLFLNEARYYSPTFIEVYNRSDTDPADLTDLWVVAGPDGGSVEGEGLDWDSGCELTAVGVLDEGGFLLVDTHADECSDSEVTCVAGCKFVFPPAGSIYIVERSEKGFGILTSMNLPDPQGPEDSPLLSQSWGTSRDGVKPYEPLEPTPGTTNE